MRLCALLALVGCASHAPLPPLPTPALEGDALPLGRLDTLPAARCGGLEAGLNGRSAVPLLDGHLQISPLKGSIRAERPWNMMGAPTADEQESRLVLAQDGKSITVLAAELFMWAGDDPVSATRRTFADRAGWSVSTLSGADGLRQVLMLPDEIRAGRGDSAPVLSAITVHPDGTAQMVNISINGALVGDGVGCTALALELARSLGVGARALDLGGGPHTLPVEGSKRALTLDLPAGFAVFPERGPDFLVYRFIEVSPLWTNGSWMGLYLGDHPDITPLSGVDLQPGQLLGAPADWAAWTTPARGDAPAMSHRSAVVSIPNAGLPFGFAHVFFGATEDKLPALTAAVASLAIADEG